jgi:hypothetical protein
MPDRSRDTKAIERQLRKLVALIVEEVERNEDFAARIAEVLNVSDASGTTESQKPKVTAFNPVEVLHREGKEALHGQLELKTDTELKEILRQQGLSKRKGEKQQFDRSVAVQTIVASAESRLHQGSSFLRSESAPQS